MTDSRFREGQQVRIADRTPTVHHRVPAYAKGHIGTIERVCGIHGEPERFIRGDGQPGERLYRVRLDPHTLWRDYQGSANDKLELEIFENWLEPVT